MEDLLQQLKAKGFKLCSALWTNNTNNVYLAYIAIKDPSKWGSHKPFGGKDLYQLFYCFAGDLSEFSKPKVEGDVDTAKLEREFAVQFKDCKAIKVTNGSNGVSFTFTWSDDQVHQVRVQGDGDVFPKSDSDWPFLDKHQISDFVYEAVHPDDNKDDAFLGAPEEVEVEEVVDAALSAKTELLGRLQSILSGTADSWCDLRSDQ